MTVDELKCHVRIHTGAKPYSCRHCSECFGNLDRLKTHLLKSHNEGTCFTCEICEKTFISPSDFRRHSVRHSAVKPYVCSECPKCFYTDSELKAHHRVHSEYKQFCCFLCDKSFKYKHYAVLHFKRCSVVRGFVCN